MKYEITYSKPMRKALGKLRKKYPNILEDIEPTIEKLKQGIFQGDRIQGFVGDVYKVRVGSIDQRKGKSGGFRVIYYTITKDYIIYLITIYGSSGICVLGT